MNVLYSTDDNYTWIAGVSILSLFENNKNEDIKLFILNNNISTQNKSKLDDIANKYNNKIIYLQMPDIEKIIGKKINVGRLSLAAYARLFILHVLPEKLDKILYLDCDTMICDSLKLLYNEDISNFAVGGVHDLYTYNTRKIWDIKKENILLTKADNYINSGVMLINLKFWREKKVESNFIECIKIFNGFTTLCDQPIINSVLASYIKIIGFEHNVIFGNFYGHFPIYLKNKYMKNKFINEKTFNEVKSNPVIIHFAGAGINKEVSNDFFTYSDSKPITLNYVKYKSNTPWVDHEIKIAEQKTDRLKRILKKLFIFLNIYREYQLVRIYFNIKSSLKEEKKNMKKTVHQNNVKNAFWRVK